MKHFTLHFDMAEQCDNLDRAWFGAMWFPVEKHTMFNHQPRMILYQTQQTLILMKAIASQTYASPDLKFDPAYALLDSGATLRETLMWFASAPPGPGARVQTGCPKYGPPAHADTQILLWVVGNDRRRRPQTWSVSARLGVKILTTEGRDSCIVARAYAAQKVQVRLK